jgi:hypothetical protein
MEWQFLQNHLQTEALVGFSLALPCLLKSQKLAKSSCTLQFFPAIREFVPVRMKSAETIQLVSAIEPITLPSDSCSDVDPEKDLADLQLPIPGKMKFPRIAHMRGQR